MNSIPEQDVVIHTNSVVSNDALNALFARAWSDHQARDFEAILKHSLGYVCAYVDERLVGFVNVAWDGGVHGFLLDTTADPEWRRQAIGRRLVAEAAALARERGMEWLHVDYEPELEPFYNACGFRHTTAGLIHLQE